MNRCVENTDVLILSVGEGVRLRPLTNYLPKALCTIANCTLLRLIVLQLKSQGFTRARVALPFSAAEMIHEVRSQAPPGFDLVPLFVEKPGRGTATTTRELLDHDFSRLLVIYGDSLVSADFRSLVESHSRWGEEGGLATVLFHRPHDLLMPDQSGRTYHGVMSVERDGRVAAFLEKPKISEIKTGFDVANAAVFVVERQLFEEYKDAVDFSYHIFQPLADRRNRLYGFDIGNGFRFDVGDLSRFYDLNIRAVRGEILLPCSDQLVQLQAEASRPRANDGLHAPILVGNDAVVCDGAVVGPEVVVGSGCVVERGARVTRSVLMDGCNIGEDCEIDRCIIGPGTKVLPNTRCAHLVCVARPEDSGKSLVMSPN